MARRLVLADKGGWQNGCLADWHWLFPWHHGVSTQNTPTSQIIGFGLGHW